MIQLVIPMAGLGSRFRAQGYTVPKPLIKIHGIEMYKVVLANLYSTQLDRVILLCPTSFNMKSLEGKLSRSLGLDVRIMEVDRLTSGPAATVSLARGLLDPEMPLVIANSDQYVTFEPDGFYADIQQSNNRGLVLTMRDNDPKWSYVSVNAHNMIERVVEKQVISDLATVGIYGFKRTGDFFQAFDAMVSAGLMVNGEHYVAPAYEFLPEFKSGIIGIQDLGPVGQVMFGLGIPEDLQSFLMLDVSRQAAERAKRLFSGSASEFA